MTKDKLTILYIDDEEINLTLFRIHFESKYNVLTSESGTKALQILEEKHKEIKVVISDMRMPIMNGVEFIKRAREKYGDLFYFILSGYDYDDEIEEALSSRLINRFFTKPFEAGDIEQSIDELVSSS